MLTVYLLIVMLALKLVMHWLQVASSSLQSHEAYITIAYVTIDTVTQISELRATSHSM